MGDYQAGRSLRRLRASYTISEMIRGNIERVGATIGGSGGGENR
jgi:hypothetical protein